MASINVGNDLVEIINKNKVGRVCVDVDQSLLEVQARELLDLIEEDHNIKYRCRNLYLEQFSPEMAVNQIVCALKDKAVAIE